MTTISDIPQGAGVEKLDAPVLVEQESKFKEFLARLFEGKAAAAAMIILAILVLCSLLAPWIAPQNPYDLMQISIMDNILPPGSELSSGAIAWLGTDSQGRDMLSAILYGMRISLGVGIVSVLFAGILGTVIGIGAAFFGKRVDSIIMRIVDLQLSFPAILIALVLLSVFGRGVDKVIIALIAVKWAYYARTVRGSALVEINKDYVAAANCLQLPKWRILFRHLLPNCIPPLIVIATIQIASAIMLESTLSFLGVGVPVTQPSLGMLIATGYNYMMSGHYWISVFPGIALALLIVVINLIGDRMRIILNPRLIQ